MSKLSNLRTIENISSKRGLLQPSRVMGAVALLTVLVLTAPLGAQEKSPFPVTPELLDKLNNKDATWPHDPAVPELPPLPATDDPPPSKDNWLALHADDGVHPPQAKMPAMLTAPVTEDKPLKADVIWSMRSPYSYLALERLAWLHSNYNVDLTIRPVMPIAVRSTKGGRGSAGGVFGVWYKLIHTQYDVGRTAEFEGVPYSGWAAPDPIWQTTHPFQGENWQYVHPAEKQPYIHWLVRLGAHAQLQGKSVEYVAKVHYLVWSGEEEHWPALVKERFNQIEGLDYDEAIEFIRKNPEKVDAVWLENSKIQTQSGHGGVPLMIFQGEPFFGQDRFDQFFWRLRQNGLTEREKPRAPRMKKPLRWPSDK